MSPLLDLSLAELQQFFIAAVPHNHHMGMRVVQCDEGRLVVDLPFKGMLAASREGGAIHEGAITTLIDTACGSVVLTRLDDFRRTATLDLRIDFLRRPREGHDVRCEAECLSVGDDLAVVRAAAYEDHGGDPIAVAVGTFAVFKGRRGEAILSSTVVAAPDILADEDCLAASVPYANMMGIDSHMQNGVLLGRMAFQEHLVGNPALKALHGGTIGTLLQFTASAELIRQAELKTLPRTFDLGIEYLSTALPATTFARAKVVSRSRRYANVRVYAYQGDPDQHLAAATVQFLLVG